jgi:hypothetical protein
MAAPKTGYIDELAGVVSDAVSAEQQNGDQKQVHRRVTPGGRIGSRRSRMLTGFRRMPLATMIATPAASTR